MEHSKSIEVKDPKLFQVIKSEFHNLKKQRFEVEVKDKEVAISAKDKTALNSITNSVEQTIKIYQKVKKLK